MKTLPPKAITYAEHASEIVATAAELIEGGHRFALITSVGIEGGAAREVGSLALVAEVQIDVALARAAAGVATRRSRCAVCFVICHAKEEHAVIWCLLT